MMTLIEANLVPLIVALMIGIVIGWWMFRSFRKGQKSRLQKPAPTIQAAPPAPPVRPYMRQRPIRDGIDTGEKSGIADVGAAAVLDVTEDVLGVETHDRAAGAEGPQDNLQMLKGVGPKLAQKLRENGITRFDQLAGLGANEIAMLDSKLGAFKGRLERDRIAEQAAYLARGDRDGFEARFGKLGGTD